MAERRMVDSAEFNKQVDLSVYDNSHYNPGRRFVVQALWFLANGLFLQNLLNPVSSFKVAILRIFGARIGKGVVIKPGVNVKYPWHLVVGDHTWIGEGAWFDSLAPITIGSHVCISQGAYFCTGNHDWSDPTFGLMIKPITIEDGAWIGTRAIVLPGVTVGACAVATAGAVMTKNAEPGLIYAGNPAVAVRQRILREVKAKNTA